MSNSKSNFLRQLGQEIREARIKKGMSKRELGHELGILDNTAMSRYENGTVAMSVVRLAEICNLLDIDPAELYAKCYVEFSEKI
jgi:transcriptional regulator with XRE-family HTH domain